MNWDDPVERLALIERVGADEYTRLLKAHHAATVVAVVNGHRIRPINTRFGRLFLVEGMDTAFKTVDEAEAHARKAEGKP